MQNLSGPDENPIVKESARANTIACEMTDATCGCKKTRFEPRYEHGKLSLSKAEFDAAVKDVNSVLGSPVWHVICFPFQVFWPMTDPALDKLDRKCKELTTRFRVKKVSFPKCPLPCQRPHARLPPPETGLLSHPDPGAARVRAGPAASGQLPARARRRQALPGRAAVLAAMS